MTNEMLAHHENGAQSLFPEVAVDTVHYNEWVIWKQISELCKGGHTIGAAAQGPSR